MRGPSSSSLFYVFICLSYNWLSNICVLNQLSCCLLLDVMIILDLINSGRKPVCIRLTDFSWLRMQLTTCEIWRKWTVLNSTIKMPLKCVGCAWLWRRHNQAQPRDFRPRRCQFDFKYLQIPNPFVLRSYHVEHTGSRPITEVKQRRAWLVLGWVTAWEYQVS